MTDEIDIIQEEKKTRRKRGRPTGSFNKNRPYKEAQKKKELARKALWKRGELAWKLDSLQKELYAAYKNPSSPTLIWLLSRQVGKSYTVGVIMLEECFQNEYMKIAYVAPTQKQSKKIVKKIFNELLRDCPVNMRPKYKTQDNIWEFPNGAEIHCVGSDGGNIENLRGETYERVFVDEFCFLDDMEYALNSVIFPTMTTVENPLLVMISSPPKTHDHLSNEWIDKAEADDTLITKTIYDCPRFDEIKINKIIKQYGSIANTNFRREYMVERIPDPTSLVLPEASVDKIKSLIIDDYKRPKLFKNITCADWGVMDNNHVLYAYYDFKKGKIVIESEDMIDGVSNSTSNIADTIKETEGKLWGHPVGDGEIVVNPVPERYCDNNLQLINDLNMEEELIFYPTAKDNLHAAVNAVRTRIMNDEILFHESCKNLIVQMKSATWNKQRTQFKKTKTHHYDGVAALVYLIRNIDTQTNPFPPGFDFPDEAFISPKFKAKRESAFDKTLKNIFKVKRIR